MGYIHLLSQTRVQKNTLCPHYLQQLDLWKIHWTWEVASDSVQNPACDKSNIIIM